MRHKGIRRLGKNRWQVVVVARDPKTGYRKEVKRVVEGTAEEALDRKREIRAEIESQDARARQRLSTYARSWLVARQGLLKRSTVAKYASNLELHVLPRLGDYWIDQLRPTDVAAFSAACAKKLEGWTVINILRLLRVIAKDAMAEGLTQQDFCARVTPPAGRVYDEDDPNLLSAGELKALLEKVPLDWHAAVLLAASTGLRWGELSGLRWDDLDEELGSIRVRRTNWKGEISEPKTKRSRRTVPLLPEVAEALREHRGRLLRQQKLAAGWVFPTRAGELHVGTPLNRVLRRACKAAKVTPITPHGLRRTFNNLARQCVSREVLKSITGHTTDAMVEAYSVVGLAEKKRAAAGVLRLVVGPQVEVQVEGGINRMA